MDELISMINPITVIGKSTLQGVEGDNPVVFKINGMIPCIKRNSPAKNNRKEMMKCMPFVSFP